MFGGSCDGLGVGVRLTFGNKPFQARQHGLGLEEIEVEGHLVDEQRVGELGVRPGPLGGGEVERWLASRCACKKCVCG